MNKLTLAAATLATMTLGQMESALAWNDISLGGMCSTDFSGGKGAGQPGNWGGGVINAAVDQTGTMETAAADLAAVLNANCVSTSCYIYNYSAGDAVLGYVLDNYNSSSWNIQYVDTSGGAGGGSDLAGDIAGTLTCSYASLLTENGIRGLYDHNQTATGIYRVGGKKELFESSVACAAGSALNFLTLGLVGTHCLSGNHDGAVEFHSAGGYTNIADHSLLYDDSQAHWANHRHWVDQYRDWANDVGDDLNHYEVKMWAICLDGGAAALGGPDGSSYSACFDWVANNA